MGNSQKLNLGQTHKLTMTSQLQQAIKLLELNAQELNIFVEQQTLENPVLDLESKDLSPIEEQENNDTEEEQNLWGGVSGSGSSYENRDGIGDVADVPISLRDHIKLQINTDFPDIKERFIASFLAEQIDDAGYLRIDLEALAHKLGVDRDLVFSIKQRLQRIDPTGLFAADLKECLTLQLIELGEYESPVKDFIENMDLFVSGRIDHFVRECGISKTDLPAIVAKVRRLNPKPGYLFAFQQPQIIIPDVILTKDKSSEWLISVNPAALPKVLVNNEYMTKVKSENKQAKTYINAKLREANFLVKALDQRARTILRVSKEIVIKQKNFFDYGLNYLKPLVLREIADELELHESTISRVTNKKYMQTPFGTFELKYFFSSTIKGNHGREEFSSQSVKGMIVELIKSEDPNHPYSDDDLVTELSKKGVAVARRTVAKYREGSGIASSFKRKRSKEMGLE